MNLDAKIQDGGLMNQLFTSKTVQTLCVTQSGVVAVQGAPDFTSTSDSLLSGQVNPSHGLRSRAKRRTVPVFPDYLAIVDAADYPLVAKYKWRAVVAKRVTYAIANINKRGEAMHRLILGLRPGDGIKVDHWNCNGLDNTRGNLRISSQSQNLANQRKRLKASKFPYKGVTAAGRKFKAEIGYRCKRIYLGVFVSPEEAARAYNAKALELFGPFARLNPLPCPTQEVA